MFYEVENMTAGLVGYDSMQMLFLMLILIEWLDSIRNMVD